jgi:uncharacterized protein YegP (UPF0339 family)
MRILFAGLTVAALIFLPAIAAPEKEKKADVPPKFEIYKTKAGKFRWRFTDRKNVEQALSAKTFDDADKAEASLKAVQDQAKEAKIVREK